jgi:putative FmdB family regulatory protein
MPIYEYRCTPCDEVFEELIVRRSDELFVRCPTCRSTSVARVLSRPAQSRTGGGGGGTPPPPSCGPVG